MDPSNMDMVEVDLGGHTVVVPKGGLYDRYRMNPDLDELKKDPRISGVDFFRELPKTMVDSKIGPTLTPNFYYRNCTARVAFLSKTPAVRARLPRDLDPLEVAPGLSLTFAMFFRYDIADIDFYTEVAVGAAVRPARHGKVGAADLISALGNDHMHAYVLSLPVSTEIAQVRGRFGYGFPKWVADIDVNIDDRTTEVSVKNEDGGTDIELLAKTPKQKRYRSRSKVVSQTAYTKIDDQWHSTFNQSNILASGTDVMPRNLNLTVGDGRLADDIRSLDVVRPVQFQVATESQLALHMPAPISVVRR